VYEIGDKFSDEKHKIGVGKGDFKNNQRGKHWEIMWIVLILIKKYKFYNL